MLNVMFAAIGLVLLFFALSFYRNKLQEMIGVIHADADRIRAGGNRRAALAKEVEGESLERQLTVVRLVRMATAMILIAGAVAIVALAVRAGITKVKGVIVDTLNSGVAMAVIGTALFVLVFFLPRIYRFIIWFVLDCFVDVYAAHAAVIERFGKRTGRVLFEGLHFKWPHRQGSDLFAEARANSDH